jgi:threonine synthase
VPTGNFGNILAAYYAKKIGLPIGRLICASNRNDVLAQFITTGKYDTNRPFFTTVSPSMDILVSSNLERLLFEISRKDGRVVSDLMSELSGSGRYEVSAQARAEIGKVFSGARCSEEETMVTIREVFDTYGYLIDTHTAVAYKALCDHRAASGEDNTTVVVSTASPFKFCESVIGSLGRPSTYGGAELIEELQELTGASAPAPLRSLKGRLPRFVESVPVDGMKDAVMRFLEK